MASVALLEVFAEQDSSGLRDAPDLVIVFQGKNCVYSSRNCQFQTYTGCIL